jgi:hypothetical protein
MAKYLLKKTSKISYPVDLFKHFVNTNEVKLGAIRGEIISTWNSLESYIRTNNLKARTVRYFTVFIFDLRNRVQAYFS